MFNLQNHNLTVSAFTLCMWFANFLVSILTFLFTPIPYLDCCIDLPFTNKTIKFPHLGIPTLVSYSILYYHHHHYIRISEKLTKLYMTSLVTSEICYIRNYVNIRILYYFEKKKMSEFKYFNILLKKTEKHI